jgi:signal-transduction protein with cAMP-binding, CBS, and nucleotidyltransferase domain
LEKSQLFGVLPLGSLERLMESVSFKTCKKGDCIFKKGDRFGIMAIMMEGLVANANGSKKFSKGDIIMEDSLKDDNRGGAFTEDLACADAAVVALIDYETFRKSQGSVEKI